MGRFKFDLVDATLNQLGKEVCHPWDFGDDLRPVIHVSASINPCVVGFHDLIQVPLFFAAGFNEDHSALTLANLFAGKLNGGIPFGRFQNALLHIAHKRQQVLVFLLDAVQGFLGQVEQINPTLFRFHGREIHIHHLHGESGRPLGKHTPLAKVLAGGKPHRLQLALIFWELDAGRLAILQRYFGTQHLCVSIPAALRSPTQVLACERIVCTSGPEETRLFQIFVRSSRRQDGELGFVHPLTRFECATGGFARNRVSHFVCFVEDDDIRVLCGVLLHVVQGSVGHELHALDVVGGEVIFDLFDQLLVAGDVDDLLRPLPFHALNGSTQDEGFACPWLRCQKEHGLLLRMSFADHCGVIDLLIVDFHGDTTINPNVKPFLSSTGDVFANVISRQDGLIICLI